MKISSQTSVDKEELIKFWKSCAFGSGSQNVLKDSSTLRDRAFVHTLAHIWKNWSDLTEKFPSRMYVPLENGKEAHVKFVRIIRIRCSFAVGTHHVISQVCCSAACQLAAHIRGSCSIWMCATKQAQQSRLAQAQAAASMPWKWHCS